MKAFTHAMFFIVVAALVLSACAPVVPLAELVDAPTQPPTTAPQSTVREAQVQSVAIQILNSDPPQLNAIVRGSLTESCDTLGESQVQYSGNTFHIRILAVSPSDRGCAPSSTGFETTIALDTRSLPSGTYTVVANGVSGVFALPVQTATPVPTATSTPTAIPTIAACTNVAKFVSDVTIPDNTIVEPGETFTKTWRLKNTGTCTWNGSYLVSYISGATMSQQPGYWIVQPDRTVAPGQTVNISVGMTAPMAEGNYQSFWGLREENEVLMPIQGGAGGNSFFVKIRVRDGFHIPPGRITDAHISIDLEQGSGAACTPESSYFVTAEIASDGPTEAYYEIGSTAGQIAAGYFQRLESPEPVPYVTGTLVFDHAETQRVVLRFVGPYPYPNDITAILRVNNGPWHSAKLACP